ncbi:hypothetical protein FB565_007421 [Actinoplanes lutulentus]|uniref:Uncharacterized protein n=1 Tax=Actinoplanes lutulentus TaxID=1287878 RepID=A0A327Z0A5_9ACTN|nr:hypothetical protein [Actinoplanes lutulentus]MBB2947650.1 hypothetical protein [Actinoplanes lutulentus]RAK27706.1 hypothetical protein B0I29_12289 [Actinoplanes lutulentus]
MESEAAGTAVLIRVLEAVGLVVAPFATLTGLLYYFGWVRTNAIFSEFGIDANLLKYTTQDYLLRSAGVAFRPCAAVLLGAAVVLLAHRLLTRALENRPRHRQAVLSEVIALALLLLAPGVGVLFGRTSLLTPLTAAAALITGVLLLEVAVSLWTAGERTERLLRRGIVAGVVVVGLFWAFSVYAQQTGDRLAAGLSGNLGVLANAVVLSTDDLSLAGPGVVRTDLGEGVAYRYQYTGLRLLVYRNDRWFLLPSGWHGDPAARAIVLPDGTGLRVELSR